MSLWFDRLMFPQALWLVLPALLLLVGECFARAPGALTVSTGGTLFHLRQNRRWWGAVVPPLLRFAGLLLLIIALAGPMNGFQVRKDRANVIDIMLCVDVSGSMKQRDFFADGEYRDRLYVTKAAVQDFIEGRLSTDAERYGVDRLGLITYAGLAWTQCPLTLDYAVLEERLADTEINTERRKDGTAIGSAIGLAVRRLTQSEAKSKVIILLTDGLNNRGELDPISAARVSAQYGIRIYTIGVGMTKEMVQRLVGMMRRGAHSIDEEMLKRIAQETKGGYYSVTDTASLQEAYAEINRLEATEIDVGDYYEYALAFASYVWGGILLLLASIFSRRIWWEVIP